MNARGRPAASSRLPRRLVGLVLVGCLLTPGCGSPPTGSTPVTNARIDLSLPWVRVVPSEVGMEAGSLAAAVDRAAAIPRFRSLLVARHGRLVLERYFSGTQRRSFSTSDP